MPEPDEQPDVPDPIAELDQTLAGLVDMARLIHGYYTGLLAAGFNEAQAFGLTLGYQAAIAGRNNG